MSQNQFSIDLRDAKQQKTKSNYMPKIPYFETSFTFVKTSISMEQIPLQKVPVSRERNMTPESMKWWKDIGLKLKWDP